MEVACSDTTFTLTGERTYVYLYLKFIDEIDYSPVTSGIKVKMTAADVNTNLATATIKYNYNPEDKISPEISYRGISLKENADNSAYQEAKVRIKYGDLALDHQKDFMRILQMDKIGISLLESLLMVPSKSVTAIIGITHHAQPRHTKDCANCPAQCEFRRID